MLYPFTPKYDYNYDEIINILRQNNGGDKFLINCLLKMAEEIEKLKNKIDEITKQID